jgi:ABC-2 type transport system permease protein
MILDRTVLWLTMRQLFARRRLFMAAAFSLAPTFIALVYRVTATDADGSAADFLAGMMREIVIGTLLPLAAVVFGTTAFGGEVDDGTLIYLLVKPLPRWRVVLSKYVVAVLSTAAVMLPAVLLPWLVVRTPDMTGRIALSYLAGAGVGCLIYCAIFVTLGLSTKRALVAGLLYIVAIEMVLSRNLSGAKTLSVKEMSIAIAQAVSNGAVHMTAIPITLSTVWTMGGLMLAGGVVLGVFKLRKFEVAERL